MLETAHREAVAMIERDPDLDLPEHAFLKSELGARELMT